MRRSPRDTVEVADARGHATEAELAGCCPTAPALIESAAGVRARPPAAGAPQPPAGHDLRRGPAARWRSAITARREVVVGLGGSATVDGGAGMATALGHRLLRDDGNGVKVGGEYLVALHRIAPRSPLAVAGHRRRRRRRGPARTRRRSRRIRPAEGRRPRRISRCSRPPWPRLADVAERDLAGGPWRELPGAGAAGGLGFGLAAFAGCAAASAGPASSRDLVGLEAAVAGADVVVTGEGRLDRWSLRGKVAGEAARLARASGARVLAIVGSADDTAAAAFDEVAELGADGMDDCSSSGRAGSPPRRLDTPDPLRPEGTEARSGAPARPPRPWPRGPMWRR